MEVPDALQTLTELFTNPNPRTVHQILTHYVDDLTYDDPVVAVRGKNEMYAQFTMLKGIFQSIVPRVISSHQNGRQIVVEMIVAYQVVPWTPHIHIRQTSILDLEVTDETSKIRNHRDLWDVASLMENIPLVGNLILPLGRRAFSFASSQFFLSLAPYPEQTKQRFIAEDGSSEYFLNKDGLGIYTKSWVPKNPKAIVILVHGAGEHCHRYDWVSKKLNESDYAVFALDHQGHGNSEGERHHVESFTDYVDDVLQYVDIVKKKYPNLPFFLLGHSMGGAVTIYTAQRSADLWNGVYLSAPMLGTHPKLTVPYAVAITSFLSKYFPRARIPGTKFIPGNIVRDPEIAAIYGEDPLVNKKPVRIQWTRELLSAAEDIRSRWQHIEWPVFIATGDGDLVCDHHQCQKFYDAVKSQDKKIKVFPS
eukprot:TRINITY_DN4954_c1_g1_i2.p1 TRINITY_DN4954_c1_g1~~TRINITY_DN4954_c1_g1_i2.p1  ORF type:complete len:421 (-),score=106.21 TRINITY_DN4954_c1_g1_i2:239-1501(-)